MAEKLKRIERAVLNISIAFLISKRGTCERAQVGAVITDNHRIVATGYNGSLSQNLCESVCDISVSCKDAIHAEANAIAFAARRGVLLQDTQLYCTHQPCYECAKLIIQSGITTVYYCLDYRLNDGILLLINNGVELHNITYESVKNHIKI